MKNLKYLISLALIFGLISGNLFGNSKKEVINIDKNIKATSKIQK